MCHQNSTVNFAAEDATSPEESLLIYCKCVELYNILQRRASENPSFLQRCLRYKIQEKHKTRLNAGNVIFTYRGYRNKIRKIEVIEEFTCPFCLMKCASFKGLRYHLCSSHDLFNFEFWVTEEYQAVSVSVKLEVLDSHILTNGVHGQYQTFCFCSKPRMRNKLKDCVQDSKNNFPQLLEVNLGELAMDGICEGVLEKNNNGICIEGKKSVKTFSTKKEFQCPDPSATKGIEYIVSSFNTIGVSNAVAQSQDSEFTSDLIQSSIPQYAKARKLSEEQSASKNCTLLKKQIFFQSHRAQPMLLDQVLSDHDSEDEVDAEIADSEDRRMLDDFVDVTKDEKHFMHLWNSFVGKQRVLADGHVPWACTAFSELHGHELVQVPALFWCWRLFMIKLWNHGLLDAATMNNCSIILESCGPKALGSLVIDS